ncbi:syntenin-2 [Sphaerodactylus townsendi]|uniref:syntenin-2 n=1 Tax=Sphaerodactylus townsendi TaxID=933632 RepID=UPI002025E67B|nr:syntenin-2 [Sphaerodactylus townsendi]
METTLHPVQQKHEGVFVLLVKDNSPAALVGLRIGEQILQIDGKDCAKWSAYKAKKALKKAPSEKIIVVVRERPFQRTVTLHRDGTGHLGFVVKKGKVASITEGSPAAWNGLLTGHYICEVNGQNVMGLKDKKIINILTDAVDAVTLTIIPVVIYEHMVRKLRDDSSDESTTSFSPFMDSSSTAGFDSDCVHSGGFSGCSHDF